MPEHYKTLVFGSGTAVERQLKETPGPVELELSRANSAEDPITSVTQFGADVVVFDLEMPGASGLEVARLLHKVRPGLPVILLSSNPNWSEFDLDPWIEMVRSPIDPAEVKHRIARMMHQLWSSQREPQQRLRSLAVEELHNDVSGRIDAKRVADLFGLSIPVLARALGAQEQALYKTPDASSIQNKLSVLERLASALLKLTGSSRGLRIWLNAPNPELDNELPIDYIKEGHVDDIAAMAEDALLGHPS